MPNPKTQKPGRPHLERDRQQWIFDYIVQQSGLVYHWWSDEKSNLPKSVRSHAMISKHMGKLGLQAEADAAEVEKSGDRDATMKAYFNAAMKFMRAQHPVFEVNAEKIFLYDGLRRSFDKVIEFSPYRIERIDVEWEGNLVGGFLHLCPDVEKAPLMFHLPGCDGTCESWPNPQKNGAHARGMHVFSFDGPGQGQSNMRGIRLTADNYERAASAVIDQLVKRPEIDAEKIIVSGSGAGSFWALRIAAADHRIVAAATKNTYTDKYYLMNEDGPRWKQLYAFLTQSSTEAELDEMIEASTLDGYMEQIECPTLMVTGEYDLRDPIEEVFGVFDQLKAPGTLWVFGDAFHRVKLENGPPVQDLIFDWARDRIDGKPMPHVGEVLYIEPGDEGPNSPDVKVKRRWYEESKPS